MWQFCTRGRSGLACALGICALVLSIFSVNASALPAKSQSARRAAATAAISVPARKGKLMTLCDIQVAAGGSALADAAASAPNGTRLCLAPGQHTAGLALERSVTLFGVEGALKTVLIAPPHVAVLRIDQDGLAIRIEGLTLQGGDGDAGGGLAVNGRGKVQVVDCRFSNNRAGAIGGGGLYARAGLLTVERCEFSHNSGRQGGGVFLDAVVHAQLLRCTFDANQADLGGGVRISEGVEADIKISIFHRNTAAGVANALHVSGSRSRVPKVLLDHSQIDDGSIVNGPEIGGHVRLKNCRVPLSWRSVANVSDAGGTTFAPP